MALATRLVSGAIDDADVQRLVRWHRVNGPQRRRDINEARETATTRGFLLRGAEAGAAWAEALWKAGPGRSDPVDLLTASVEEVYNAFDLGAWRDEWDLTPDKAAIWVEDYQRATGNVLDYRRAFGDGAAAVGAAVTRRHVFDKDTALLLRALKSPLREAAEADITEELDLLTEEFTPKHTGSKVKAAMVAWPTLVVALGLSSDSAGVDLLAPLLRSKQVPNPNTDLAPLPSYADVVQIYIQYLLPDGKFYPEPSELLNTVSSNMELWLAKARKGVFQSWGHIRNDLLLPFHQLAKDNHWNGKLFWTLVQAWRQKDWKFLLDALAEDSDLRVPFAEWVAKQGKVVPDVEAEALATVPGKDKELFPLSQTKLAGAAAAEGVELVSGTPIYIGPLTAHIKDAVKADGTVYIVMQTQSGGTSVFFDSDSVKDWESGVFRFKKPEPAGVPLVPDAFTTVLTDYQKMIPGATVVNDIEPGMPTVGGLWFLNDKPLKFLGMFSADSHQYTVWQAEHGNVVLTAYHVQKLLNNGQLVGEVPVTPVNAEELTPTPEAPALPVMEPGALLYANTMYWYVGAADGSQIRVIPLLAAFPVMLPGSATDLSAGATIAIARETVTKTVPPMSPNWRDTVQQALMYLCPPGYEAAPLPEENANDLFLYYRTGVKYRVDVEVHDSALSPVRLVLAPVTEHAITAAGTALPPDSTALAGTQEAFDWIANPPAAISESNYKLLAAGQTLAPLAAGNTVFSQPLGAIIQSKGKTKVLVGTARVPGTNKYIYVTKSNGTKSSLWYIFAKTGNEAQFLGMDQATVELLLPMPGVTTPALPPQAGKPLLPIDWDTFAATWGYDVAPADRVGFEGVVKAGSYALVGFATAVTPGTKALHHGDLVTVVGGYQDDLKDASGALTTIVVKANGLFSAAPLKNLKVSNYPFPETGYLVPEVAWGPVSAFLSDGSYTLARQPAEFPYPVTMEVKYKTDGSEGTVVGFAKQQDKEPVMLVLMDGKIYAVANAFAVIAAKTVVSGILYDGDAVAVGMGPVPAAIDEAGLWHGETAIPLSPPIKQPPFSHIPKGKHVAAGAVMIRYVKGTAHLVLTKPTGGHAGYTLGLPKGTVDIGESIEQAAVREVYEETGIACRLISYLGDYEAAGSIVRMFVADALYGNVSGVGDETDAVVLATVFDDITTASWWPDLATKDGNTWQQKAVLAGYARWKELGDFAAAPSDTGESTSQITIAPNTTAAPFPVPSLNYLDGDEKHVEMTYSEPIAANQIAVSLDYRVDVQVGEFTTDEWLGALADGANVQEYTWMPWSVVDAAVSDSSLALMGYPPPGAGILFTDEEGDVAAQWVMGYYRLFDGIDYSVQMLTRLKIDDAGDPNVNSIQVMAGGTWTPVTAFPPLSAAVSQTVAAGPSATTSVTSALLHAPFPTALRHAKAIVAVGGSVAGTVTELIFRNKSGSWRTGDRAFLEAYPDSVTVLGFVDVVVTVNGKATVKPVVLLAPSPHAIVSMAVFTKDYKKLEVTPAAGTYFGMFQHKDAEINARIMEVGKGLPLDAVNFQLISFRAALYEAGFPHARVLPEAWAQVAASCFMPNGITAPMFAELKAALGAMSAAGKAPKATIKPSAVVVALPLHATAAPMAIISTDYAGLLAALTPFAARIDAAEVVSTNIGGTNPNTVLRDKKTGLNVLAKGSKDANVAVRVAAEVGASLLMGALSADAIPVMSATLNGKMVSIQPMLEIKGHVTADPVNLSMEDRTRVLVQHVFDMFVQDFDGHTSNWVMTPAGIRAIDKGRSFKPFLDGAVPSLAIDYNPSPAPLKSSDRWYAKALLTRWSADPEALALHCFGSVKTAIAKVQGLTDAQLAAALTALFDAKSLPLPSRTAILAAIGKWRDGYLESWTNLLTMLRPGFTWPSMVPVGAPPDMVLDSSAATFGLTSEHAETLKRVKASGYQGQVLRIDRAAIERQQVLVKEADYGGTVGCIVEWKVREDAGKGAAERLAAASGTALSQPVATSASVDPYAGVSAQLVDKHLGLYVKIRKAVGSVNKRLDNDWKAAGSSPDFQPEWSATATAAVNHVEALIPVLQDIIDTTKDKKGMVKVAGVEDVAEGVFNMATTYIDTATEVVEKFKNWKDYLGKPVAFFKMWEFDYDGWKKVNDPDDKKKKVDAPKSSSFKVQAFSSMQTPNTTWDPSAQRLKVNTLDGTGKSAGSRAAFKITSSDGKTFVFFAPQWIGNIVAGGDRTFGGFCWGWTPYPASLDAAKKILALFEAATAIAMRPATELDNEIRFYAEQATLAQNLTDVKTVTWTPGSPSLTVLLKDFPLETAGELKGLDALAVKVGTKPLIRGRDYTTELVYQPGAGAAGYAITPTTKMTSGDTITVAVARGGAATSSGAKVPPHAVTLALAKYETGGDDAKVLAELKKVTAGLLNMDQKAMEKQAKLLLAETPLAGSGMLMTSRLGWDPDQWREAMRKKNGGLIPLIGHVGSVGLMVQGVPALVPTAMRQFIGVVHGGHGGNTSSQAKDAANGGGDRVFTNIVAAPAGSYGYVYYDISLALSTRATICGIGDTYGDMASEQQNTPERWLADSGLIQDEPKIGSIRQLVLPGPLPLASALFIVPDGAGVEAAKAALKAQGIVKFAFGRSIDDVVVSPGKAKTLHANLKLTGGMW